MEILPKIRGGFRYPSAKSTRSRSKKSKSNSNKKRNGKRVLKGGKSKKRLSRKHKK